MTLNISTNPKTIASWDTINSPQAYSYKPAAAAYVHDSYYTDQPKKSSTLGKITKAVVAVAVVAGALAAARKNIKALETINVNNAESYKGWKKVNYYVAKAGQFVIDTAGKCKFWGKEGAKAAEKETAKS